MLPSYSMEKGNNSTLESIAMSVSKRARLVWMKFLSFSEYNIQYLPIFEGQSPKAAQRGPSKIELLSSVLLCFLLYKTHHNQQSLHVFLFFVSGVQTPHKRRHFCFVSLLPKAQVDKESDLKHCQPNGCWRRNMNHLLCRAIQGILCFMRQMLFILFGETEAHQTVKR